jgi:hypothetical protein
MDSMRTLNSSLPSAGSKRHKNPSDISQVFRNAALSVTNLYKAALSEQQAAQEAGYQEALEELMAFLDKESLGIQEGEGKKIRQWVTERFQGTQQAQSESEEEVEEDRRARSSSPVLERKPSRDSVPEAVTQSHEARPESAPPLGEEQHNESNSTTLGLNSQAQFTFRSPYSYPLSSEPEMEISEPIDPANAAQVTPSMRLEVRPGATRQSGRILNRNRQRQNFNPFSGLGNGAGYKRRLPFGEFFDIGNGKDMFGGGKRSRHI